MIYEINKIYHGFVLKRMEFIEEIGSHVYYFVHSKTKAELSAIKNDDQNKTFCIAFKTIPTDSNGVAHIMEHSVLSGSEKYPLKDVFAELSKGGLSTFLNAMTSIDKTYYPFATRNVKEYFNLMSVYLDTTLRPILAENTFLQEGWHYELLDKDKPITYKGIVYNEMKGALASPIRQLSININKTLFPGSTYSVISGGDPAEITNLSYEKFKEFHKKFYHPSNAKFYIYGDAELDQELEYINSNYLSSYDYQPLAADIDYGRELINKSYSKFTYSVNGEENIKEKTYLAIASRIDKPENRELNLAFLIISNLLFNSDASPLKSKMINSGICRDFSGSFTDSAFETSMISIITGSEEKHKDEFLKLYYQILEEVIENGIDKELIQGEINSIEFHLRESSVDVKRGLHYMYDAINSLIYGHDLFEELKINKLFDRIRKKALEDNYFEKLIKKYLLDNKKTVIISMIPDHQKSTEIQEKEEKKLGDFKKSLNEEQLSDLIKKSKMLIEKQKERVDKEEIKKVPKLTLADIEQENVIFEKADIKFINKTKIISNELFTNDIIYLSFGFNLKTIPNELLSYLDIFSDLFTRVGTDKRDYIKLSKDITSYLGGISSGFKNHTNNYNRDEFVPMLWINLKTLYKSFDSMVDIINDLFQNLNFDNKKRIKDLIQRQFDGKERKAMSEGIIYPLYRIKSIINSQGGYLETVRGLTAYETLKDLNRNYDDLEDEFIDKMKRIKELIFNKENLLVNITGNEKCQKLFMEKGDVIINSLPDNKYPKQDIKFQDFGRNQALINNAEIVFATQGGNLYENGFKYDGRFEVLKNYLSADYLFNKIRVLGGAYGAWVVFNEIEGDFYLISYRDPNVKSTYQYFSEIADNLRSLKLDEEEFNNIKIGAYASFEPLLNSFTKGLIARDDYLSGIDPQHYTQIVEEILNTTQQDLRDMADVFESFNNNSFVSIIGNKEKIMKDKSLFDSIINI